MNYQQKVAAAMIEGAMVKQAVPGGAAAGRIAFGSLGGAWRGLRNIRRGAAKHVGYHRDMRALPSMEILTPDKVNALSDGAKATYQRRLGMLDRLTTSGLPSTPGMRDHAGGVPRSGNTGARLGNLRILSDDAVEALSPAAKATYQRRLGMLDRLTTSGLPSTPGMRDMQRGWAALKNNAGAAATIGAGGLYGGSQIAGLGLGLANAGNAGSKYAEQLMPDVWNQAASFNRWKFLTDPNSQFQNLAAQVGSIADDPSNGNRWLKTLLTPGGTKGLVDRYARRRAVREIAGGIQGFGDVPLSVRLGYLLSPEGTVSAMRRRMQDGGYSA